MVLIMAKEITVTFEDGGIFEGFANTYTLNNEVTYYFSFDRDYRVQLTDNNITLQEYRNAGAWYPIDIITNFAVTEISGTGGGDVTKDWVNQNFVKKAGDTMTGVLNFDFGNGRMVSIGQSKSKNRGLIILNGDMQIRNQEDKVIASIATSTNATINLYKASNGYNSNIYFRNYTIDETGLSRSISYTEFRNNDTNTTWEFNGKYQANNTWWFKYGGVYFDTWAYWRSNDIINTIIQNNGGIRIYNGNVLAIHEMAQNAETNYYSAYKYNGRDTYSNVGGQDPRYRITGYNNFVDSMECYKQITIKTEGQNTAKLILSRGFMGAYSDTGKRRAFFGQTITVFDENEQAQYRLSTNRFDVYNGNAVICHNGPGSGGTDDIQAAYKYNGIDTYNYNGVIFNVNIGNGYYSNDSRRFEARGNYVNIRAMTDSGMDITAPTGFVKISDSKGVMGRSSNTENNTYITNTTQNVYVQSSQTVASDTRRDELTALLDLFRIVYNVLESAGIPGASAIAQYTSDVVLWIYDNQNGVLKPTVTKIRNLIHN